MNQKYKEIIEQAYKAFNARDIDAVLSLMEPTVQWPNGWEGGYVHGHQEVRDYWIRQWKEIDPTVKPLSIKERTDGRIEVHVQQTVKDLQGNVLFDGLVKHVYTFDSNDKIKHMEIVEP